MESKPASPKKIAQSEATLNEKLTDRMADDRRYSLYL